MSNIQLKNDMCHLFVEQDNTKKVVIEVYFDISDFEVEQEIYDFFGEKIYGNGREHLNDIFRGTKLFGGGLSSFYDYLTGYLIEIHLNNRKELLSIEITNKKNIKTNDFYINFISLLVGAFFDSYQDICSYADFFEINIAKDVLNETMTHFSYLLANYAQNPEALLGQDYV